tara:strand:- start:163 stop:477 length:315 start_codon:yes stop_codon:yes gene_type:complete
MTTSEKAVDVLKTKYGIDARIYEDNVYLAVWNDDLSDTIDVEASKGQVEDWASEYIPSNKSNKTNKSILAVIVLTFVLSSCASSYCPYASSYKSSNATSCPAYR